MAQEHWLYRWMAEQGVRNVRDAERALSAASEMAALRELIAREVTPPPVVPDIPPGTATIAAGASLDLSGSLDLWIVEGKKAQLDRLFRRVWHYFDQVVVTGPSALSYENSGASDDKLRSWILADVELLTYIQEIGAKDLLIFRDKRFPAPDEFPMPDLRNRAGSVVHALVQQLVAEAAITVEPDDDHARYRLDHPLLEHTQWGTFDPEHAREAHASDAEAVAWRVVGKYLSYLGADLLAAAEVRTSLGSTIRLHGALLRAFESGGTQSEIAFHMVLPVLEGVELKALLDVREEQRDHFVVFRRALSDAIRERSQAIDGRTSLEVAAEIQRDVIEPALSVIHARLDAAASVLNRKHWMNAGLAGLATVFGAVGATPLAGAAVLGAIGSVMVAEGKYAEDVATIQQHEMYFLWEAAARASGR